MKTKRDIKTEDITSSSTVYEVTGTERTNTEDRIDFDDRSRSTDEESGTIRTVTAQG